MARRVVNVFGFFGLLLAAPLLFGLGLLVSKGVLGGWPAAIIAIAAVWALWWLLSWRRSTGRATKIVLAVPALLSLATAWLCVPVASLAHPEPPPSQVAERQYWELPTGSRLAYWHLSPPADAPAREFPVVLVHGGPGGYAGETNRRFLTGLAAAGYHVWIYDQAGGGDSDLLPETQYSHQRNVADFAAVLDAIGAPKVAVINQSYGAQIVASALADPVLRERIAKAIFVEPGAYDAAVEQRFSYDELYEGSPSGAQRAQAELGLDSALAKPRIILGLLLPADNGFLGQDEATNAFAPDLVAQAHNSVCATNYDRVDTGKFPIGLNLKANYRINASLAEQGPLKERFADSKVPIMVMLGECSYIGRPYQTALITDYPLVDRVAYLTGVGHSIWDGLDDHDAVALQALTEYLAGEPPTIANYPTADDVAQFLADRK